MATAEGVEVPVWVNGVQKWVAGVDRTTTCQQLVQVLLAAETDRQSATSANAAAVESRNLRAHTIVERWGQTERPLQPRDRVLKAMRCWPNDGRHHVQLLLKKTSGSTSGGGAGGGAGKSQRRRHQQPRHRWRSSSSLETLHPRKLATGGCWRATAEEATSTTQLPDDSVQHGDTVERLMRMIIVQGETIQAQLRRLQERDCSISQYEHKMHQIRVQQLGSDYLLRAYLRDGGSGSGGTAGDRRDQHPDGQTANDSRRVVGEGDTTLRRRSSRRQECASTSSNAVPSGAGAEAGGDEESLTSTRLMADYLSRVVDINARIVDKEEQCSRLRHRIRRTRCSFDSQSMAVDADTSGGNAKLAASSSTSATAISDGSDTRQLLELEVTRAELQRLAAVGQRQQGAVDQTERTLALADRQLDERRCYLQYLEYEMAVAEQQSQQLADQLQALAVEESAPLSHPQLSCGEAQHRPISTAAVSSASSLLSASSVASSTATSEGYASGCGGDSTAGCDVHNSIKRQTAASLSEASTCLTKATPATVLDKSTAALLLTDSCSATAVTTRLQTGYCADKHAVADSNSDTGLSSLDSSGDETVAGAYMLETLV